MQRSKKAIYSITPDCPTAQASTASIMSFLIVPTALVTHNYNLSATEGCDVFATINKKRFRDL